MKHFILVLCILVSVHQAAAQTLTSTAATDSLTWTIEQVPTGDLLDGMLNFISPDTGWVTAHNIHTTEKTIYQTTDGGMHWQLFPPQTRKTVFILNQHTYFAYEHDSMFKTTDAGETWFGDTILIQRGGPLQITPVGADTIYALGDGEFGRSYDGGHTWIRRGLPSITRRMAWADSKHGIVVGDDVTSFQGPSPIIAYPSGIIYTTHDCGKTFTPQCDSIYQALEAVWYFDPAKAMVAGDKGTFSLTTDAGMTWKNLSVGGDNDILGLWFIDSARGFAVGQSGLMLRTEDCGKHWETVALGTTRPLYSIFFFNDTIGYVTGDSGILLRTFNGGQSWVQLSPTHPFSIQIFPNPAATSITINYRLSEQVTPGLVLYDALGHAVSTPSFSSQEAGTHWLSIDVTGLSSGVYHYSIGLAPFSRSVNWVL